MYYLDDKNLHSEEGIASQILLKAAGIPVIRLKLDTTDLIQRITDQFISLKID